LHEQAGAAGVVQVHMGEHQPVHLRRRAPGALQCRQHRRHGQAGATVDEGGAAVFDDQVGGIEIVALKGGIDGVNAGVEGHRLIPGGNRWVSTVG
jgi:hypothetical protein